MVIWVNNVDTKIAKLMTPGGQTCIFRNVTPRSIISAILRLLDARYLTKELQLTGIKLLRKIVEVENKNSTLPGAEWDSDDYEEYKRIIMMKQ